MNIHHIYLLNLLFLCNPSNSVPVDSLKYLPHSLQRNLCIPFNLSLAKYDLLPQCGHFSPSNLTESALDDVLPVSPWIRCLDNSFTTSFFYSALSRLKPVINFSIPIKPLVFTNVNIQLYYWTKPLVFIYEIGLFFSHTPSHLWFAISYSSISDELRLMVAIRLREDNVSSGVL